MRALCEAHAKPGSSGKAVAVSPTLPAASGRLGREGAKKASSEEKQQHRVPILLYILLWFELYHIHPQMLPFSAQHTPPLLISTLRK